MYLGSENKGPDQLGGYREADLRLCFRICKKPVFLRCVSTGLVTLQQSSPLHEPLCTHKVFTKDKCLLSQLS